MKPKGLILNAPGINCNLETGFALEQAGTTAEQVHIAQLRSKEVRLSDYQMIIIPGGFSFGDDISSGRILGLELRKRFAEDLNRHIEASRAIIGICNGFQVLVESGILPDGHVTDDRRKRLSLVNNANNTFECRWNDVVVQDSVCKFIGQDLVGQIVSLPSAHQEGRVAVRDQSTLEDLAARRQIVFRYVDAEGEPTESYPENPNGSPGGITGICDETGVVLGLMPHPERAIRREQHPNWRRGEGENPFGAAFFKSIVNYAKES